MCMRCRAWGHLWTAAKMVYCILHLWYGAHTWNTSSHFVLCCSKWRAAGRVVKNTQPGLTYIAHSMVLSTPWSDIVPRGVLWRNLTERPGELQLEPWMPGISSLEDIFPSWRARLRSAILRPIKRLHVRRPLRHHTAVLFPVSRWLP